MIHQLAARKATQELEESHGWISDAKIDSTSALIRKAHPAMYNSLLRREAVRLGVEFQIAGKHCSFVAVETNEAEIAAKRQKALQAAMGEKSTGKDEDEEDWEILSQRKLQALSFQTFSAQRYILTFPFIRSVRPTAEVMGNGRL
jgi:hypothetical protein